MLEETKCSKCGKMMGRCYAIFDRAKNSQTPSDDDTFQCDCGNVVHVKDFNPIHANALLHDFESLGREYGREAYPNLDEKEQAVIAVGMTPLWIIRDAEDFIRGCVARRINEHLMWGLPEDNLKKAVAGPLVENFSHGVVNGLMEAATAQGKMIA